MLALCLLKLKMYRGLWAGGASTPGYGIGPTDLKSIQSQLVGLPITVEHEGLMAAAETVSFTFSVGVDVF